MTKLLRAVLYALTLGALGILLSACSGMRLVDNDVTSFALWASGPPARGTTYRFERLPSQQAQQVQPLTSSELPQQLLEDIARSSLDKVGLVNNPANAQLNVQVMAVTRYTQRYPDGGFFGRPGLSLGVGTGGTALGFSFPLMSMQPPLFNREVSLIMRDARSNAVVFETRAFHNGVWGDAQAVVPAMMDAALSGFPVPPAGTRRVNVEIPR